MRARLKLLGFMTVLATTGLSSVGVAQAPGSKAVEDEIIRIVRAQWAAEAQKNAADAMKNIASDYTEFNADYSTRLEGRDLAKRMGEIGFMDSGKLLLSDMINPKVQVYGNVAILTYNFVGVSQDKNGVNSPSRAKSTRVYVKTGNDWMLVHANFGSDPVPTSR